MNRQYAVALAGRSVFASIVMLSAAVACAKAPPRAADTQHVSTAPDARTSTPDTGTSVSPQGYGAVRIGASVAQLGEAIGSKIPPSHSPDELDCRYVMLAALPSGMRVMLVHDSVARIDVARPGPRTAAGVGVGDDEAHVVSMYGPRAIVRPNKYTGPVGHDIVVLDPADSTRRLIFETDGKNIVRYRAGKQPAVDLVEGCG
ncbi:MAG TPA: hypothetical protein VGM67_12300 [Gemmatimonadaceae bacterium]|jgi:hypothetical protein